ncbi:MAG: hypothetical protein J6T15_02385 [Bacilli bacterium]|nr:hypothetical protein [Bacilli bacterium]
MHKRVLTIIPAIFCFCSTACSNINFSDANAKDITVKAMDYLLEHREKMPDNNLDEYNAICVTTEAMENLFTFYSFYKEDYFGESNGTLKLTWYSDYYYLTKPYLDSNDNICYEYAWEAIDHDDIFVYMNVLVSYDFRHSNVNGVSYFYTCSFPDYEDRTFRYIKHLKEDFDGYVAGNDAKESNIGRKYFKLMKKFMDDRKNADSLGDFKKEFEKINREFNDSKYDYEGYIIFD